MSSNKMPSYVRTYTEQDLGADGTIDKRDSEQFTYDARGNVTNRVYERDWNADGTIDNRDSEEFTYDTRGNVTSRVTESDYGADGTINVRYFTRYEYDNKSNVISAFPEPVGPDDMIASLSADLMPDQLLLQ